MKLSIIICVYNERDTVLTVLEHVQALHIAGWEKEVIIVDNCSTDGTRELLKQIDYPNVSVVYHPKNMGKGASIRTAIEHARGDYIVIQDADLEYAPEDILKLVAEAEKGAVAIFGSRTLGGQAKYKYAHAYLGVRLITQTMNVLFGGNLTDAATASKMVRRDVLQALNLVGSGFDLDFELPDKLLLAGIKIVEVPILYNPRTYEEGKKIKAKDGLFAFLIMLRDRLGLSPVWKKRQPSPTIVQSAESEQ